MSYQITKWICQGVSVVVFFTLIISNASANSFDTASKAYRAGEFKKAARIYSSLAGQGDAAAQFSLGEMYVKGKGVPQNDNEAFKWYRLAAEQGLAQAQYNLGSLYAEGKGISQSYQDAYAWWIVAAMNGKKDALKGIETGTKQFTAQEVEKIRQHAKLIWSRTVMIAQK